MPDWIKTAEGYGGTVVKAFHQGQALKLLREPEDPPKAPKPAAVGASSNLPGTAGSASPPTVGPAPANRGGVCAALALYWLHYRATETEGFWDWADSREGIAEIARLQDHADEDQYEDMLRRSKLFKSVRSDNRHELVGDIDQVDMILSTVIAHDGYQVLSLKKKKGHGHALGFHVDASDTLHFMDPNQGEAYFGEDDLPQPIVDPERWTMTSLSEAFGFPNDPRDPRYQVALAQMSSRDSSIKGWTDTSPTTLPASPLVKRLAVNPKNVPMVTKWFEFYLRVTKYKEKYDGYVLRRLI